MAEVAITVDGKKIIAKEGSNLLEAAVKNGIVIPHMCHDPRIKPFGSCRMCFVDMGDPRGPVAACGTTVTEGMNVITDSETLRKLRRTALELLLSEHCGDCIAPCQLACPAGIDIQGYIAYMDRGEYKRAADLIKERMPLPSICGRVCPRFCEEQCRRNLVDDPVNICDLKRFAGDFDLDAVDTYASAVKDNSGKAVAVVGGGPAGLTAAYYLALEGHAVTLYDRGPELGGMLRYGIPAYRLPRELLDREAGLIAGICREVRLGEFLGRDFSIDELQREYDAVFLGLGCQAAQGMGLEKEDLPGIYRGIEFLRSVEEGSPPELGRRVAVVGGGNTAMDAARTALRLGATEVSVIYRRSISEMPANPVEIAEAEEEGIRFYYLTNPVSVMGSSCVSGVECVKMELGEPDESGRRRPVVVEGSEFRMELDNVIMAIGQALDQENAGNCSLELSGKNLAACDETGRTPLEGVFAAGDAVTGPATVVEAVGAARRAAISIDRYLKGLPLSSGEEPFNCSRGRLDQMDPEDFSSEEKIARIHGEHLSAVERKGDFREYNPGLNEEEALHETGRCLSCGCQDLFDCTLRKLAADYGIDTGRFGTEKKRYPVSENDPYIVYDPNKCILCASCVRICSEVQDANALCLVNRGYDTVVKPALGLPLAEAGCESCGQCVSTCPTGALSVRSAFARPGPWKDEQLVRTTCLRCSTGCALELHIAGGHIVKVTSPLRRGLNEGNLCVRGRFGYDGLQHDPDRLTRPLVRDRGMLREAEWEEALNASAKGLKEVIEKYGAGSIAVLVSPENSNEEAYFAQKLARTVIGTPNIDSTGPAHGGAVVKGLDSVTFADLEGSDLALVIDADLPEDYPIVAQKARKVAHAGKLLAVISQKSGRLERHSDLVVPVNPGGMQDALRALLACLAKPEDETFLTADEMNEAMARMPETLRAGPEKMVELASLLLSAEKTVVIMDSDITSAAEFELLEEALRLSGNGGGSILSLSRGGNTRGLMEMGVNPAYLPGGEVAAHNGLSYKQIVAGGAAGTIRGMLLIGEEPGPEKAALKPDIFTVVIASSRREWMEIADVILPAPALTEKKGTAINCEGRIGELNPAFHPPADKACLEVIKELAAALGNPFEAATPEELLSLLEDRG